METNRLHHFCTIVETQSLTRAAQLLGITHGGLHKSIRVLEAELGYELTSPKGRGIEITKEGLNLYPKALEILKMVGTLEISGRNDETDRSWRIGGLEVFMDFLPGPLTQDSDLSAYHLSFFEVPPGELEEAVTQESLDVGLTYIPILRKDVEYLKIGQFEMCIFTRNRKFLDLDFKDIPFVVPSVPLPTNLQNVKARDGWRESLVPRKAKYRTNSLRTALEIVDRKKAAIFMPKYIAKLHSQSLYPIPLPMKGMVDKRDVFMVVKKPFAENKLSKKLARYIRNLLK